MNVEVINIFVTGNGKLLAREKVMCLVNQILRTKLGNGFNFPKISIFKMKKLRYYLSFIF